VHIIRYRVCKGRQIISLEFAYEKDKGFHTESIVQRKMEADAAGEKICLSMVKDPEIMVSIEY